MNVKELIEKLKQHPADMRVVLPGYEGGVDDVDYCMVLPIKLNRNTETWYYGKHEECNEESKDETALEIG
jgi:hypothetical protein